MRVLRDASDPSATRGVADGVGSMVLTVVDVLTPRGEGPHVFYRRSYVPPDGPAFGSAKLLVDRLPMFAKAALGHGHPYDVADEATGGGL